MTGDEIVQQALRNARSDSLWLRANGYTCFVREAGFVSGWALAQIDLAHTIGADPKLCRMHNYRDPRPKDPEQ